VGWNEQEGSLKAEPYGDITADEAQPLDLAMSDGTFVRVWDSDETELANNIAAVENLDKVVGIVYWVGTSKDNPVTEDLILKEDHPKCTHGYILALNDMSDIIQWQSKTEYAALKVQQDKNSGTNPGNSDYEGLWISYNLYDYSGNLDLLNVSLGYQTTKVLRLYNYYYSDAEHKVHPIEKLDEYVETHEAPEGSSGWYFPSAKELVLINCSPSKITLSTNYGASQSTKINTLLTKLKTKIDVDNTICQVGDVYYNFWSSTECYLTADDEWDNAFGVSAEVGYIDYVDTKVDTNFYRSRAICAF
jgi:hypothetical protein